ncbi:potassium transporter [Aspergillus fumigatus Af293]|uniref:Potassium transporter n=2 Tax=Aspergillus fumigatus TaxID=746128 RepID=Q4X1M3_ASPFU|nr:potassium transporter [Aspergillus fumigatus Af293]EAL93242.1 potassium transporter [Aspergillus fumigatus Af293]EDP54476.1 potassium transporter [Aspergillus fumigatus A1163]
MMYISSDFPTAITMRKTNVYEERSVGVYEHDSVSEAESRNGKHVGLAVHIQRQLGFDLCCMEDIVDSNTHWIMQFCCNVNRMEMTRRND